MHVHSKYSYDAVSNLESIFSIAKKKGMDGIALTDHGTARGWKDAKKAAKKHKMQLICGEEIKAFDENGKVLGDVLCFFLQQEIKAKNFFNILDIAHAQDALVFYAHPFDKIRTSFKENVSRFSKLIDGMEVFNSRTIYPKFNEKAEKFAKNHRLPFSAGSDAHIKYTVGDAFTEANAETLEEFRKKLMKRHVKIHGIISPGYFGMVSIFARLIKYSLNQNIEKNL